LSLEEHIPQQQRTQLIEWVLQYLTLIAAIAVAGIYFCQLRTMQGQLTESRDSSNFVQAIALAGLLQNDGDRLARTCVIKLKNKPYDSWSHDENGDAAKVCASFSLIGALLKEFMSEKPEMIELFAKGWSATIRTVHPIVKPHIDRMQRDLGDQYWQSFDWLHVQAEKYPANKGLGVEDSF